MQISSAALRYNDFMKARKKSVNTQKNYLCVISRLIKKIGDKEMDEIAPDDITAFMLASNEKGAGGSSSNTYLAALRSFFGYAYRNKYTSEDCSKWDECKNIDKATAESARGKRQYRESDEIDGKCIPKEHRAKIYETALGNARKIANFTSTEGERNALMIRIGMVCGFRVSDLVDLKVKNFNFKTGRTKVYMKKVRSYVEFHVGEKLINEIEAYSNKNGLAENDYLFPTYKSPYMSTKSFWATFNAIIAEAGLDAGKENDGYSVHDMRRTCATEMYYKTSLKAASMRLGHKNIAMTEHYLRIKDTEENTAAIDRAVASLL